MIVNIARMFRNRIPIAMCLQEGHKCHAYMTRRMWKRWKFHHVEGGQSLLSNSPSIDEDTAAALNLYEFLSQGEWWISKTGMVRISEMPVPYRRRSAAILLKKSSQYAVLVQAMTYCDAPLEPPATAAFAALNAPQDWMKGTTLYRSMTAGGADPDEFWRSE